MRYEITKEFSFDSAHQLPGEETYGKCANVHGHTYKLFVTVGADMLTNGMVMNFTDLKEMVNILLEKMDHHFLNDVDFLKENVTTCEYMAEAIFNEISTQLMESKYTKVFPIEIKLYETPTSYGTYRG